METVNDGQTNRTTMTPSHKQSEANFGMYFAVTNRKTSQPYLTGIGTDQIDDAPKTAYLRIYSICLLHSRIPFF